MFAYELHKDADLWRQFGKAVRAEARRRLAAQPRLVEEAATSTPAPEDARAPAPATEPTAEEAAPPAAPPETPAAEAASATSAGPAAPQVPPRAQSSSVHTFQAIGLTGMRARDLAAAMPRTMPQPASPPAAGARPAAREGNYQAFARSIVPTYGPPPPFPLEWLKQHPDFHKMGVRGSFRCSSCHQPGGG